MKLSNTITKLTFTFGASIFLAASANSAEIVKSPQIKIYWEPSTSTESHVQDIDHDEINIKADKNADSAELKKIKTLVDEIAAEAKTVQLTRPLTDEELTAIQIINDRYSNQLNPHENRLINVLGYRNKASNIIKIEGPLTVSLAGDSDHEQGANSELNNITVFPAKDSDNPQGLSDLEILRSRLKKASVGAHQGGMNFSTFPNTLKAFEKSRQQGSDMVELDLNTTKDGVPVVYHDESLDTWTNCKGKVRDKTLIEIKKCKFKLGSSQKIPTLEEVFAWSNSRIVINAEFKDSESIEPAIHLLQKWNAYSWVYFQTKKSHEKYYKARNLDSRVALLYVIRDAEDLNWAINLNDDYLLVIELHKNVRTPEIIAAIHAANKLASENSWHFSKTLELFNAQCDKVFNLGIDIAITNNPKKCVKQKNNFLLKTKG